MTCMNSKMAAFDLFFGFVSFYFLWEMLNRRRVPLRSAAWNFQTSVLSTWCAQWSMRPLASPLATSRRLSPKPRPLPPQHFFPHCRWCVGKKCRTVRCHHWTIGPKKVVTLSFRFCPADGASVLKKLPLKRRHSRFHRQFYVFWKVWRAANVKSYRLEFW